MSRVHYNHRTSARLDVKLHWQAQMSDKSLQGVFGNCIKWIFLE